MSPWIPTYPGVVNLYFTSNLVITGIVVAAAALLASFVVFAVSKNHETKGASLLSSVIISTSMWVFVLTSLVFCAVFMGDYRYSASDAIGDIARFALLPTVALGPVISFVLRNHAMKKIYPYFTYTKSENDLETSEGVYSKASLLFSKLLDSAKLSGVSFSVIPGSTKLPPSAALDWRGKRIVGVSDRTLRALDDDELKAVLAHELGHIVHKDTFRKTIATAYRSAFIFDPLAHFVEAAIYRDGELYADEYSARLTGKPAALASALIKLHESMRSLEMPPLQAASLLLNSDTSGILSKEPSLTKRIKRLLEMEEVESHSEALEKASKEAVA